MKNRKTTLVFNINLDNERQKKGQKLNEHLHQIGLNAIQRELLTNKAANLNNDTLLNLWTKKTEIFSKIEDQLKMKPFPFNASNLFFPTSPFLNSSKKFIKIEFIKIDFF